MSRVFCNAERSGAARPKTRLISQILDLLFIHAEVVRDLVQHRQTNFLAQLLGIGKIFEQGFGKDGDFIGQQRRIETGSVWEWDSLVNAI